MRHVIGSFPPFAVIIPMILARPGRARGTRSVRLRVQELEPRLALSSLPTPDHVVLVIEENHGYSQIIGNGAAPYINDQLAKEGALFTNSYAIEHPSQPNYLDLFSGSNQGVTSDACPQSFDTPNLADGLEGTGYTFTGYSEDLPYPGFTGCMNMAYGRNHNPWVNFQDVSPDDNLPFDDFPADYSQLPTVAIVVPNTNDDMHNGMDPARIQAGDQWLQKNVDPYVQWAYANNSLLIVTFDEDNNMEGNHIVTLFVGPMVQPGQYDEYVNHYVVLRTLEDMYGLPYAGASADVNPITDVWTTAAAVDHFAVTVDAADPTVAGTPFDVTVTAQDANGHTVPNYTGTVHFSSADPYGAALPADYTFQPSDQGAHTFSGVTALYTAGTWDVSAADTTTGATGSAFINVQAAPAVGFYIDAPASITSGTAFDVSVYAVDPYGNTDTNYGGTVTWTTTDRDPGVVLPQDYTFQSYDQGAVTFPDGVTLITPGDQTLVITDTVSGITGSADVTVTPGPAADRRHHRDSELATDSAALVPAAMPAVLPIQAGTTATTPKLARAELDQVFPGVEPGWFVPYQNADVDFDMLLEPGRDSLSPWELLTDPFTV